MVDENIMSRGLNKRLHSVKYSKISTLKCLAQGKTPTKTCWVEKRKQLQENTLNYCTLHVKKPKNRR